MFKFIHCADLHLDSPLRGLSMSMDVPLDEIRSATRRALRNLVKLAIDEEVDFVVIAGDVYDGDWPDYTTGLFFNACMARLNEANIPVFLISGNHDAASNITRSLVLPPNVIRFSVDHPETHLIESLNVALHGQGFKQREVRDNLVPTYPNVVPGWFNIGILHTSAEGQEGHETYAPCRVDELARKGYDYWALGHIHKRQVLHEEPYIVFPGNLQGRHIRETGEKGCMLVTVDGRKLSLEFHSLDVLRWCLCSVDLTGVQTDSDFAARITAAIAEYVDANSGMPIAIRILLQGRTPLHGALLAEQERYHNEVANSANMSAPGRIWIEKVKFATEPPSKVDMQVNHGDAVAGLSRSIERVVADVEFLESFSIEARAIQTRMSAYIKSEGATLIETADDVKPLLEDAQSLLLEMMAKGGAQS